MLKGILQICSIGVALLLKVFCCILILCWRASVACALSGVRYCLNELLMIWCLGVLIGMSIDYVCLDDF